MHLYKMPHTVMLLISVHNEGTDTMDHCWIDNHNYCFSRVILVDILILHTNAFILVEAV